MYRSTITTPIYLINALEIRDMIRVELRFALF